MFTLKNMISRNAKTELEDTALIKFALTSLGYYDDTETGLSPYADDRLFKSVENFQKDSGLKVDGVIKTDGPTQEKIKEHLKNDQNAGNAFMDFKRNFDLMNEAKTDGADKYFHCVANYEAASRGWAGKAVAQVLSEAKEIKDQYYKGYPKSDSNEDQKANRHGRAAALSDKYSSAREACAIFRPRGLDEKY